MNEKVITIPTVALRGMTILPGMVAHFDISREKSMKAIEEAMMGEQDVFLITQRNIETEDPDMEDLYRIGIIAKVKQVIKMRNGIVRILVEGERRGEILELIKDLPYLEAEVFCSEEEKEEYSEEVKEGMRRAVLEAYGRYAALNPKLDKEYMHQISETRDAEKLMDLIANNIPVYYEEKQKYLEAVSIEERYQTLIEILLREINIISIKNEFQAKVKEQVDKNQKEYLLREQMKVIREELGEDNTESDADLFLETLKKLQAGKEVKEKIRKEIERFKNINSNSSESAVARGYIETLLELPWDKASKDNRDLKNAARVLDADHYGMEKVKERMLEFLAVRNLTSKGESPIICLVGPPGTGKTSIAKSVAKALDKEYVRICLGGVRDEAEIRGHRRTYVGAMPGRIASGLRMAGVKNPLMLLDEIDKVSSELIEVSSYTENEKMHIAKEHLVPKQIKKNGLKKEQISIRREALAMVIRGYTKEAGVRSLERKIGEICRKAAREIYEGNQKKAVITKKNLEKYLGKEKYSFDQAGKTDEIGIVRGLAWTSVGGDTLEIEVNVMPGKGEFRLTGQLGDVMKESAQAGISYIRSVSKEFKISKEFFKENDIHIHIPEGAVPKDGPSAGITMATAMLSAITKKKVRADVAMTGEITLRGRVLPIGGLKEKTLAAKNAGIKIICVPAQNEKDMEEIAEEIKQGLKIVYVETMKDVLDTAFV